MSEAVLKVFKEDKELSSQPIHETLLIGRNKNCELHLDDRAISREHAFLRLVDEGFEIKKKSQFGQIRVNGKEVTHAIVSSKDVIEIGPYRLKLGSEIKKANPVDKNQNIIREKKEVEKVEVSDSIQSQVSDAIQNLTTKSDVPFDIPKNEPSASLELESLQDAFEGNQNKSVDIHQDQVPFETSVPSEFSVSQKEDEQPVDKSFGVIQGFASQDETRAQSFSQFSVVLKVLKGSLPFTEFPIKKDRIVLGRSSRCDITLPEKKCSRENTEIFRKNNRYFIKDLGSSNGTRVNGIRVEETQLVGNENILIGDTEFKFEVLQKGFVEQKSELDQVAEKFDNVVDFKTRTNVFPVRDPLDGVSAQPEVENIKDSATQRILGIGSSDSEVKNLSLIQQLRHRFKTNSRFRILVLLAVAASFLFVLDEEQGSKETIAPKGKITQKEGSGIHEEKKKLFEDLTDEEKSFVVRQRDLAFEFYRDGKYDDTLLEIDKIFQYVDDYNGAKDLRRYSLEGKRIQESKEEERRRAEKEKKIAEEVLQFEAKAQELIDENKFDLLEEVFSEILSRQPENQNVPKWRQQVQDFYTEQKLREQEQLAIERINQAVRSQLEVANEFKASESYLRAIDEYKKVLEMEAPDKSLTEQAQIEINAIEEKLSLLFEAPFSEGSTFEESGDLALAYKKYEEADKVDPRRSEAKDGMKRVFGSLEERAKVLYTEAVVSESLSDFIQAKKKFAETLEISPKESIYYERSQRKLSRYKNFSFE